LWLYIEHYGYTVTTSIDINEWRDSDYFNTCAFFRLLNKKNIIRMRARTFHVHA
jgi:hypothetical protein